MLLSGPAELDAVANERQAQLKATESELDTLKSGDIATSRSLLDESKRVEQLQQQRSALIRQASGARARA